MTIDNSAKEITVEEITRSTEDEEGIYEVSKEVLDEVNAKCDGCTKIRFSKEACIDCRWNPQKGFETSTKDGSEWVLEQDGSALVWVMKDSGYKISDKVTGISKENLDTENDSISDSEISPQQKNQFKLLTATIADISKDLSPDSQQQILESFNIILEQVIVSAKKDEITYHNPAHWNELLSFMNPVLNNMPLENQESAKKTAEIFVMFHDIGYYNGPGDPLATDHEDRSIGFLESKKSDIGLTDNELDIAVFMTEMTKLEFGSNLGGEFDKKSKKLKSIKEKLDSGEIDLDGYSFEEQNFIRENFASFIDKGKISDPKLLSDGLLLGVTASYSDIFGNSRNYPEGTLVIRDEFALDNNPSLSETKLGQAANSAGFLTFVAWDNRLSYLEEEFGIAKNYVPESVKNLREENIEKFRSIENQINILKGKGPDTFTQDTINSAKSELESFISGLDSPFISESQKNSLYEEVNKFEEEGKFRQKVKSTA